MPRPGGDPLHRLPPTAGMGQQVGVVGVEDAQLAALQQAPLDCSIGRQGAVALQVIGGEGGPDADARPDRVGGLDLITAHLHHQPIGRLRGLQAMPQHQLGGGDADVAAHRRPQAGMAQQVAQQMGDGGLAIGAGDADPGHRAAGLPGGQQITLHGHAPLAQGHQGGMVPADARAHHNGLQGAQGLQGPQGFDGG